MKSDNKNKTKLSNIGAFPWYPIVIALYAPLALLAHNLGQVEIRSGVRAILVTVVSAVLILFLARLVLKDWARAGAASAVVFILFFTYGHVYTAIKNYEVLGIVIGRHRYLVVVWVALAGLGLWWSVKRSFRIPTLSSSMNLAGVVLLIYPLFQVISYASSTRGQQNQLAETHAVQTSQYDITLPDGQTPPDVYYIILDAYGRSDTLLKILDYDNSAFLNELKQLGFYIAECAQSNYAKTDLSLSSSLNMDYVTALGSSFSPESTDRLPLWTLIKNNEVKAIFEDLGYTTVAFDTGYDFTQVKSSDVYYTAPAKGLNGFENLYLQTTLVAVMDDFNLLGKLQLTPEDRKRELILFKLAELQKIPASLPSPKFVFAHLVIPHQPFVFGPDGEPFVIHERTFKGQTYYPNRDYALGYHNQAIYISQQILEVVKVILQESDRPPVIMVQGDHGLSHFGDSDRMTILSTYYFPEREQDIYPSITPVNSFRLLFNQYFNADFDLLEDVSYYSDYPYAYQFEVIPNTCQPTISE